MDNLGVNIKPKDAKGDLGEEGSYKLNIVIHVGRGQKAIPDYSSEMDSLLKMGRRLEVSRIGESEPLWLLLELLR